jgi:serine/threonine-protein kinase RsbT
MATDTGIDVHLQIHSPADIIAARHHCRTLGSHAGFPDSTVTVIATAVSEIARNIVEYAQDGEITMNVVNDGPKTGIEIVASDRGPGIPDVDVLIGEDGDGPPERWRPSGMGLPATRRLMDEFEIVSAVGRGTTVTMKKWKA